MVVKVEEIRDAGLTLNEKAGVELVAAALGGEGQETGFRASEGFPYTATFRKVSGGVLLNVSFSAYVDAPCKRCLADVRVALPVNFTLHLVPESLARPEADEGADDEGEAPKAGSFDLGDADRELFDGKKIDLDPILREQVLLALPMHAVCKDDCKGLCTVCGQNLNDKDCGCERKVLDPRLAPLKDIKLN